MNRDLFLAILSLDSYNRGYEASLNIPDKRGLEAVLNGEKIQLGNAKIGLQSFGDAAKRVVAEDSGFFAVEYDVSSVAGFITGGKVIAFRGTNGDPLSEAFGNDVWNGWSLGLGFANSSQAQLAMDFYKEVAKVSVHAAVSPSVWTTGHSLGGGLAGFVSALSGARSVIFDHMPFGVAAVAERSFHELGTVANGTFDGWSSLFTDRPSAYYVNGEFLEIARSPYVAVVASAISAALGLPATLAAVLEAGVQKQELGVFEAELDLFQRHDPGLLVNLLYAQSVWENVDRSSGGLNMGTDWRSAAPLLLPAILSDEIGTALGLAKGTTGAAAPGLQLANIIAYSAISEGEDAGKPFGDTAILAMFDDATDLGRVLKAIGEFDPTSDDPLRMNLVDLLIDPIVQFAGNLAQQDIEQSNSPKDLVAAALRGILTFNQGILEVDFRDSLWGLGISLADPAPILNQKAATDLLVSRLPEFVQQLIRDTWGADVFDLIDRLFLPIVRDPGPILIGNSPNALGINLYVGDSNYWVDSGLDQVRGSAGRDVLAGNGGADSFDGGDGDDALIGSGRDNLLTGGAGNDILVSLSYILNPEGFGDNLLIGGDGNDILVSSIQGSDFGDVGDTLIGGAGEDSYLVYKGANTVIDDDTGRLFIDGTLVGGRAGIAQDGTIESGIVVKSTIGDLTLGNLGVLRDGANLRLGNVLLLNFSEGDFGIYIDSRSGQPSESSLTSAYSPDRYGLYQITTQVGNSWTTYEQKFFATDTKPPNAKLLNTILDPAGRGTVVRPVAVNGSAGNDSVYLADFAPSAPVTVSTGWGNDVITSHTGRTHSLTVNAGPGRDFITTDGGLGAANGGDGDDEFTSSLLPFYSILSSTPLTVLYGGAGKDRFEGANAKLIDGGPDIDTLVFDYRKILSTVAIQTEHPSFIINADSGIIKASTRSFFTELSSIEKFEITLGQGNDTIVTGALDDVINAGAGSNVTRSGDGNDNIVSEGADTIYAGGGNDVINRASGTYIFSGGRQLLAQLPVAVSGAVIVYGEGGDDIIDFSKHRTDNSFIDGGEGNDNISISGASNRTYGGLGNDIIKVGSSNFGVLTVKTLIDGGIGDDLIDAFGGNFEIYGGTGNDQIKLSGSYDGSVSNSIVYGGVGNDFITLSGSTARYSLHFTSGDGKDIISPGVMPNNSVELVLNGIKIDGFARFVGSWLGDLRWELSHGTGILTLSAGSPFSEEGAGSLVIVNPQSPNDKIDTGIDYAFHPFDFKLETPHNQNNTAPVGTPSFYVTDAMQDRGYVFRKSDLLQGISDPDGDDLTIELIQPRTPHGSVIRNGDLFIYTPVGGRPYDILSYDVTDGKLGRISVELKFDLKSVNIAPHLTVITAKPTIQLNGVIDLSASTLLQGFSDSVFDVLSVEVAGVRNATIFDRSGNEWILVPDWNFSGTMGLDYLVSDNLGASTQASFLVTVQGSGNTTRPAPIGGTVFLPRGVGPVSYQDFAAPLVLRGGPAADSASGTPLNDQISGAAGNDVLRGLAGNDSLSGGDGNDNLDGGAGADTIDGGSGDDRIEGGDGLDTVIFADGASNYRITKLADGSVTVQDLRGALGTGTDTLTGVETLRFANVPVQLTDSGPSLVAAAATADQTEGNSGNRAFTFTVTRSGSSAGTSTATWAVSGSGTNPASASDFGGTLPTGTVNFAAGETMKTISVNVSGDSMVEADEGFTLMLSSPSAGTSLVTASAGGIIRNDDASLAVAATTADQTEGSSGSTAFTFTVARTGSTAGASSANWAVTGSGANAADASDFAGGTLPSGTVSLAAGETSKVINVNVNGESLVEPDEGFTVTLSAPSVGTSLGTAFATGIIRNDDAFSRFVSPDTPRVNNFAVGAGGWSTQDRFPRQAADINGDGFADIVGFGQAGTLVSLGSAAGTFAASFVAVANFGVDQGWSSDNIFHRELIDVNNDGRDDIVGFGTFGVLVSLAQSNGSFGAPVLGSNNFNPANGWTTQDGFARTLADVNGDGFSDIVGFGIAGTLVALGTGTGSFGTATFALGNFGVNQGWTSGNIFHREVGDVNGDGRADIVGFGTAGTLVALGQANGSFAVPTLALSNFGTNQGWSTQDVFTRDLADVDGDGRDDIVGFGVAGTFVAYGQANGTFSTAAFDLANFGRDQGWSSDNIFHRELADVNGDGRADIVGFGQNGVFAAVAFDGLVI